MLPIASVGRHSSCSPLLWQFGDFLEEQSVSDVMLLKFMSRLSFLAVFPTSNNTSMSSFDLRKKPTTELAQNISPVKKKYCRL